MTDLGLIYVIFLLPRIYVCSLFFIFEKTNRIYIAFMTRLVLFFHGLVYIVRGRMSGFQYKRKCWRHGRQHEGSNFL